MSAKNSLKAIALHFAVTSLLLVCETLTEAFLRWNPGHSDQKLVDAILRLTNWFLVGTIAQFCLFAFLFLLLNSAEELILRYNEFWSNLKHKKRGVE
jgi:hypothetical protein